VLTVRGDPRRLARISSCAIATRPRKFNRVVIETHRLAIRRRFFPHIMLHPYL